MYAFIATVLPILSIDVAERTNTTSTSSSSSSASAAGATATSRSSATTASKLKAQLLDDLSSDSDDEFFDFIPIPLGNRTAKPNPVFKLPTGADDNRLKEATNRTPSHSQSVPAVNKLAQAGQASMVGGNAASVTSSANVEQLNNTKFGAETKATKQPAPQPPERAVTPSPSLKKYPAPQPPGSLSRQASSASIARPTLTADTTVGPAALTRQHSSASIARPASTIDARTASGLARQHSSASIARNSLAICDDGSGNMIQRSASVRKYPAPQPPGVSRQSSMASIASLTANDKIIVLVPKDKSTNNTNSTMGKYVPNGVVTMNGTNEEMVNGIKLSNFSGSASGDASTKVSNNHRSSNGHIEDVLSAFKRGVSESRHMMKNGEHKSEKYLSNGNIKNTEIENKKVEINRKNRCNTREVTVEKNGGINENKSRSTSREPISKKSLTGKLAAMANKFESDSTMSEPLKSKSEAKVRKFSNIAGKNKLGCLASKFEVNESSSDIKSPLISKLQSPYSRPFDPAPINPPVEKRKSIAGINVSKFGGTGKFPTHWQLKKSSKAGIEVDQTNDVKDKPSCNADKLKDARLPATSSDLSSSVENTMANGTTTCIENKTAKQADEAFPMLPESVSAIPNVQENVAPLAKPESTNIGIEDSVHTDLPEKISTVGPPNLTFKAAEISTTKGDLSNITQSNVSDAVEPASPIVLRGSNDVLLSTDSGNNVCDAPVLSSATNVATPKATISDSISADNTFSVDETKVKQHSSTSNTLGTESSKSDMTSCLITEIQPRAVSSDVGADIPKPSPTIVASTVLDPHPISLASGADTVVHGSVSNMITNSYVLIPEPEMASTWLASCAELPTANCNISPPDFKNTDCSNLQKEAAEVTPNTRFNEQELSLCSDQSKQDVVVAYKLGDTELDLKPSLSEPATQEYFSPALQLDQLRYSRPAEGSSIYMRNFTSYSNTSCLSSLTSPITSIYTRASSVSPSIRPRSPYLNGVGLNLPYTDEVFRARSLTPMDGIHERRSVRPKSRFLSSESPASGVTASALDLEKPESALEKYRKRKEMRNSAAKAKLDALTKQSDASLIKDNTNIHSSEIPVTRSTGGSTEGGMKFKIDLSSIKDFLRKTEEEISKLPRYIREPWSMSEILSTKSGARASSSTTTTTIPTWDNRLTSGEENNGSGSPEMLTPTANGTENNSRKSSATSIDRLYSLRSRARSCDGEEEIYVDANDAIDTSQMDTLMPLPDSRDIERRCRSVTPSRVLANTEKVLSQTDRILKKSRSGNSLRKSYSRSMSAANIERLSEVVADLAEEHSTAQLAGERLEAEQADRMRLEKELDGTQTGMRELTLASERLESEKSALRTEMLQQASCFNNGDITDTEDASSASLYKRKFEWSQREVESLKQQLRQHQQDEQEQTSLLKKQLEKKVTDAREETEEQRQVAGQLKKRTQRLQAEMNDLKILLEEQAARNCLLEKKQRKFDSELTGGQDELRVERLNKDKVMRERDAHLAEKYAVDQEVSTLKLELELRDERVAALARQVEDLSVSGQGDHELAQLRKARHELESKVKDQEEELDELAGQVQMLEAARTRLEMSTEQMRKENRKEVQQREEDVEEVRISAQKKVKALEAQVETEHEERTHLMRDKHELERRLLELMDRSSVAPDEDAIHRLKKDLRKTKALLKDTQTMLEKTQSEGPSKLIIRQLKTQLEDCEFAKTAALKARQSADVDLCEIQSSLEDTQRARKDVEDRASRLLKEKTELQTQLEEGEELHVETLKKYKSTVSQISVDQITLTEQSQRIAELEHEKQMLSDRLLELNSKVEVLEGETANIHTQRMLQMKVKELESKLELEFATRKRIEGQVGRQKEQIERLSGEWDISKMKESQSLDQTKKLNRQLRQAKDEAAVLQQRNTELTSKKQELEKQMELMDSEISTLKSDLKLAFKRIEDLQMALQGDISDSDSDLSDSDSDTSITSYLTSSVRVSRCSTSSSNAAATSNTATRQPNRTGSSPTNRGEDLMSPGSDAMAIIEEAKEEMQHSESESFA